MEDNEKVVVETKSDQRLFTMVYHDFLTSELLNYYEKMIFIYIKNNDFHEEKQNLDCREKLVIA